MTQVGCESSRAYLPIKENNQIKGRKRRIKKREKEKRTNDQERKCEETEVI